MSAVLNTPLADGAGAAMPGGGASTPLEWGDLAAAAKAAGTLKPEWKTFITTKFFVPFLRSEDDNPKNFLLHLTASDDDGSAALVISELRERLDQQQGDGIVALSGADIVCRLDEQGSIRVVLRQGVFSISTKRVDWLRSGIGVTRKRIATRKLLVAAAPAAPLPVLGVTQAAVPAAAKKAAPPPEKVHQFRFAKPALLSAVGIVILAALIILFGMAQGPASAPMVFEAPLPPAPVARPAQSVAAAPAEPAMPFAPVDNSFTVNLPGVAEEMELSPDQVVEMGDKRMHLYRLRFEDRMYAMEATDYAASMPQSLSDEMDSKQESIIGSDGTLIASTPLNLRGVASREVRVRLPNGGERAARFAFVGSKFSMVMITVPNGAAAASQIDTFLNSFQLK